MSLVCEWWGVNSATYVTFQHYRTQGQGLNSRLAWNQIYANRHFSPLNHVSLGQSCGLNKVSGSKSLYDYILQRVTTEEVSRNRSTKTSLLTIKTTD